MHPTILAMLVAVALTPPAGAEWTAKWSNGHQIRSEDGDFALKLGGGSPASTYSPGSTP